MTERPSICESCKKELPQTGHYELAVWRKYEATATWKFDTIKCIGEFAEKYAHLDDAIAGNDERDKQS